MESERDSQINNAERFGVERLRWPVCLAAANREDTLSLADELGQLYQLRMLRLAASGLGMLQMRDSVRLDGFHLGEFTWATAAVELRNAEGEKVQGAAALMQDDEKLVVALSILDGVLSAKWPGWKRVQGLLEEVAMRLEAIESERRRIRSLTTVDFSTLDQDSARTLGIFITVGEDTGRHEPILISFSNSVIRHGPFRASLPAVKS